MFNPWQLHRLYSLCNSPGQNTGVGSCSLLQGIFPTQGSNPGLSHCRRILYQLSHQGSPRILEWVVYAFSNESSQLRNWTRVSCIAGGFFTSWATREASYWWAKIFSYFFGHLGSVFYKLPDCVLAHFSIVLLVFSCRAKQVLLNTLDIMILGYMSGKGLLDFLVCLLTLFMEPLTV